MREIKLRAWDKIFKKWDYFTLSNLTTYLLTLQTHLLNGDEFYQYTGLKDKNGKEIYEGDIIRCYEHTAYGWQDLPSIYVIGEKSTYGKYLGEITVWDVPFTDTYDFDNNEHRKEIEVIGNIYENPSLLEAK